MADDEDYEDNTFNEEQITEFQEAFELFDRDNDGTITLKEFCTIMRSFGQQHYEIELEGMFKDADEEMIGTINFVQFLRILKDNYTEERSADGIVMAFSAFDPLKKGIILADDLREYMMTYGDKLTEEEANEFVKMADTSKDGKIMYEYFVNKMAAKLEKKQKYERKFPDSKKSKK